MKKSNVTVSLYFEDNTVFKVHDLSHELINELEKLGDPMILPENRNFPQEANAPILLFVNNKDFQFVCNFFTATLILNNDEVLNVIEYIKKIMSIIKKHEINIYRIGYVNNILLANEKIIKFGEQKFKTHDMINCKDFEISWLDYIVVAEKEVNCWNRYFTNQMLNENLNVLFDINTKANENVVVDLTFVEKFINESNDYIEKNIFE